MYSNMKIEGLILIIERPCKLQGAEVAATDLRAAAALILAGLCAEGTTRVTELKHLDRGYVDFAGKLEALGADIERVDINEEAVNPFVKMDYAKEGIIAEFS